MRKLPKFLAAIVASAFALSAFGAVGAQAADPRKNELQFSIFMQDGQVRLTPKEIIVISQPNNPSTGYTVKATVKGKKKSVKLTKGFYSSDANPTGAVGAGGTTYWGVEALKPGIAYVKVTTTAPSGEVTSTERLKVIVMEDRK
ncbi:MAG: protease inhibitor I42 family protein [Candidatus Nanopelagicales bacterium]|nr:protease inhibitor I42 family protein [Candidatus Nanopelagicales bacterium]